MGVYVGCDVGTVSVKAAVVLDDAEPFPLTSETLVLDPVKESPEGLRVFLSPYRRIQGNPLDAALGLLDEVAALFPRDHIKAVAFTGSAGKLAAERLGLPHVSEFKALAVGVGTLYPEVRSILEMGGENSKYLRIDTRPEDGSVGIVDYDTNGDCAAGTGSFIDQQAARLRYAVEDVGDIVASADRGAKVAGRCSVFAKSDMIHAQQKGSTPPQVLRGLCEAVARNYKANVAKGRDLAGRAAFVGGLARNRGVHDALRRVFDVGNGQIFVPEASAYLAAVGSALLERSKNGDCRHGPVTWARPQPVPVTFPSWPRLTLDRVQLLADQAEPPPPLPETGEPVDVYLGVDVGSVSTNLVLTDRSGAVLEEIYLRTEARPVEVVDRGLAMIREKFGDRIAVRGVGTTGSGRELIGELLGADTVNDEITAHKTGSFRVAADRLDRQVDTIFEIGGQDAKFIRLDRGVVVDFTMNEACAAGTGSFLEEQAEKLGVRIVGEFSELAFASESPVRMGERCTVYMEQDVSAYLRRGAPKADVIAGLAYSVVQNYLNRVVRGRSIGDVIFFQGGTAYNNSVAAAFAEVLGKEIIVPPHNGVMGAYGAALLAQEKMEALGAPTTFRGFDLEAVDYSVREFTCPACSNACDIQEFNVEGSKTYWGDKCSEKYRKAAKVSKEPVIPDLFALRAEELERDYFAAFRAGEGGATLKALAEKAAGKGASNGAKTIGLLRSMYYLDRAPFYRTYLAALGVTAAISDPTTKKLCDLGIEAAVAEPCFPIQAAHGHLLSLAEKNPDRILLPSHVNEETDDETVQSHVCPWGQTLPFVLKASPAAEELVERFLIPILHFRQGEKYIESELWETFRGYAADRAHHRAAVRLAYAAQAAFRARLQELGRSALEILEKAGEPAVVLVGRPYNIFDAGLNLNLPGKLRRLYGINVIPFDFLPAAEEDLKSFHSNMYWNYGRRILRAALWSSRRPDLHLIYITNFKCGPDSYVKTFATDAAVKPFLTLQFDAHGNDAGMMTRCEAYLDSKGILRWWRRAN